MDTTFQIDQHSGALLIKKKSCWVSTFLLNQHERLLEGTFQWTMTLHKGGVQLNGAVGSQWLDGGTVLSYAQFAPMVSMCEISRC